MQSNEQLRMGDNGAGETTIGENDTALVCAAHMRNALASLQVIRQNFTTVAHKYAEAAKSWGTEDPDGKEWWDLNRGVFEKLCVEHNWQGVFDFLADGLVFYKLCKRPSGINSDQIREARYAVAKVMKCEEINNAQTLAASVVQSLTVDGLFSL
jgi:hypothetical protein